MANHFSFDEHAISSGAFGLCIILIFSILITYDITKKLIDRLGKDSDSIDTSENTSIDIRLMIYINLFIILIHQILISFNFAFASSDTDCKSLTKYGTFIFHIIRCIMYLIFVRRIKVIYGDTIFALTKFHQYILYFIIAIYSLPFLTYTNWYFMNVYYNKQFGCLIKYNSQFSQIYFIFNGLLECLIIIYCLYLFIIPLHKLIKNQENKQISYKLYHVMIKYFVLYLFSIFSCIILNILSFNFSFGYNYSLIDGFINGIILILLHPIHNKFYKNICCCCCHSLCIILFDAPTNDQYSIQIKKINKHSQRIIKKISDNSPISPTSPVSIQRYSNTNKHMEISNENNNTDSIRNIMKQEIQKKIGCESIQLSHHMQSPISLSIEPIELECKWTNIQSPSRIISISPCSPCDDIIILEDEEIDINDINHNNNDHLTLKDVFSFNSFMSVESMNSYQEFERKKSNTVKLINFESIKL